MVYWLNTGPMEQQVQRLIAVGVAPEMAKTYDNELQQVTWLQFQKSKSAVLFIPCRPDHDSAMLYLLSSIEGNWHAVDNAEFDCHYDSSVNVETAIIRDSRNPEILVHHAGTGHGTGYFRQNFKLLNVIHGKLVTVLDRDEIRREHSVPEGERDIDQSSTFTVVPSATGRTRQIEETRSTILNGKKLTVQRRYFHWSNSRQRYVAGKFSLVSAP